MLSCSAKRGLTTGGTQWVRNLVQVAGRRHLPGSRNKKFPKHLQPWDQHFPHRLQVEDKIQSEDVSSFASRLRPKLDGLLHTHGAVLLKGLPIQSVEDFSCFYTGLGYELMTYVGGSGFRHSVAPNVFTGSVDPPEYTVEPHNEMAYLPYWPHLIFFYCETEAEPGCGGENGLTDVRTVYDQLDPEVKEKFNRLGVRYWRYFPAESRPNYPSWRESLKVETRAQVEEMVTKAGNSVSWDDDGSLCFWTDRPAISPHYRTGEMLWFGQIPGQHWTCFEDYPGLWDKLKHLPEKQFPFTTLYGDGSVIELDVMDHLREVTWKCTKGSQLKQNEVLVFDNMLFSHCKMGFTGPRLNRTSMACYKAT
ncbi:uncharacterized protein LOC135488461 [Lineus longissimus]|uniref:uncharacterized protein LOC135488461 n=1 Tax=Lineus longissimus TaxID=88925 RepID=UPI00315C8BA1